jgi:hypothetical protein
MVQRSLIFSTRKIYLVEFSSTFIINKEENFLIIGEDKIPWHYLQSIIMGGKQPRKIFRSWIVQREHHHYVFPTNLQKFVIIHP